MRGFTLIEVLVVLLIMGLLAGLVAAIARPDHRALLRLETERLAQLLDLAAAEARFTGSPVAWIADGSTYRFWRLTGASDWTEVGSGDLLRARTLPQGILISALLVEDRPAQGAMRLAFDPHRPARAFSIELTLGEARATVAASPVGELRVLEEGATIAPAALQ